MFPDLVSHFRHSFENLPRNQSIVVRTHGLADGSFVAYHFLGLFLRSRNGRVCMLSLNHPQSHYVTVCAKTGVQLQRSIDTGRCRFIDFDAQQCSTIDLLPSDGEVMLKNLFVMIKNAIDNVAENDNPLLLIIDGIDKLLNVGLSLNKVIYFLRCLRRFSDDRHASILVLTQTDERFRSAECDDPFVRSYHKLAEYLLEEWSGVPDFLVEVKPLSTGWSKDVQGEITIKENRSTTTEQYFSNSHETRLLYKLSDRNISLVPLGLVPKHGV